MANLGEMLSTARQQRGLPIDEVARRTRIRAEYIAALEQNQFGVLPGDVYARGFVRNYALVLGLPVDEAIAAYEESAAPPKKRTILGPAAPTRRSPDPIRIEPLSPTPVDTRLRYAPSFWLVSAFGFVALIIFLLASNVIGGPRIDTPTPTAQPATPTQLSLPVVMVSNTPVLTPFPTPGGAAIETPVTNTGGQIVPSPTSGVVAGDPGLAPTATLAPAASPIVPTVAPTITPTSGIALEVGVNAGRSDAWVQVQTDGKIVMAQTLAAGTKRAFTAKDSVQVRTGRGDIVRITINGVDKGYIGAPNQTIVEKKWDAAGTETLIR